MSRKADADRKAAKNLKRNAQYIPMGAVVASQTSAAVVGGAIAHPDAMDIEKISAARRPHQGKNY